MSAARRRCPCGRLSTATTSTGTVSQTTCDRTPAASAAAKAAAPTAPMDPAVTVIAWTPTAAANPAMSLSGRAAVIQNSGDVAASSTAKSALHAGVAIGVHARNSAAIASTAIAALTALSRLSACASDGTKAFSPLASAMNTG